MMPPYSHLKVVHNQQIQEALERRRLYAEQETPRQGLLHALGMILAHRFGGKHEKTLPNCTEIEMLPDTTLEDLRMLVPLEPAAVEECDAACA
jgi:hypothetical protein